MMRELAWYILMSKTASAQFYRCSNKREYRSDMELVNLINSIWWLEREISWKGLIFTEENNNKKSLGIYWFILITSPSQTNPKPLILYWSHFLKTSFSLTYHISFRSQWVCSSNNHAILFFDCYWNPWSSKLYMSQGLLD